MMNNKCESESRLERKSISFTFPPLSEKLVNRNICVVQFGVSQLFFFGRGPL
jgi:hypothetical protein